MLFSTPRGGRFSRAPPFTKNAPTCYHTSSQRQPRDFGDCGAAGGIFPPAKGALNPPRTLHFPGAFLGAPPAGTLPSYANRGTREPVASRGMSKVAATTIHYLDLV